MCSCACAHLAAVVSQMPPRQGCLQQKAVLPADHVWAAQDGSHCQIAERAEQFPCQNAEHWKRPHFDIVAHAEQPRCQNAEPLKWPHCQTVPHVQPHSQNAVRLERHRPPPPLSAAVALAGCGCCCGCAGPAALVAPLAAPAPPLVAPAAAVAFAQRSLAASLASRSCGWVLPRPCGAAGLLARLSRRCCGWRAAAL